MRNADMPAMPRGEAKSSISTLAADSIGLTKREYFAATMNHEGDTLTFDTKDALTDFLGRDVDITDADDLANAVVQAEAKLRVMRADALLAELEKSNA